jgi:hypothetical protein
MCQQVPSKGVTHIGWLRGLKPSLRTVWKEEHMRLIKRIAISVGSLLALAVAGGAHFKF